MDQASAFAASLFSQARVLGTQAKDWAYKNRPTTIVGWLGVCSAAGVASAVTALALIVALILTFCALAALVGAAFAFGITLGFWLCIWAWMALAFSAIAAALLAWLLVAHLSIGLLRRATAWVPWSQTSLVAQWAAEGLKAHLQRQQPEPITSLPDSKPQPAPPEGEHSYPTSQRPLDEWPRTGGSGRLAPDASMQSHGGAHRRDTAAVDAPQRPHSPPATAASPPSPSPSPSTSSSSLSPPSSASMEDLLAPPPPPPPEVLQQQQQQQHYQNRHHQWRHQEEQHEQVPPLPRRQQQQLQNARDAPTEAPADGQQGGAESA
ncbi:hypothetical protein PLESTB_001633900 [Pleodorina starrii]|uniref:Uncharacterized protein n=1 Tax=Pleodorina starrii TaxID=330485 RepID=A0A9W6F8V4_9CHLO|nr:hypothetical protein PLESTM_001029700 [Pleodorina starrii]GLC60613.1 hypothetical protein PLESTB_001633900 [Pleodorina starrii]GLC76653.1 hypothetical protein PLESTF_001813500 [Pleodorina starrii]